MPQPYDQLSFQRDGREIARYHYGTNLNRPFLFPLVGPAGVPLTRMGHPRDPVGHSHHNSAWIAHHDVNGTSFWSDRGTNQGREPVHQRLEPFQDDGGDLAMVTAHNVWIDRTGRPLLQERRRMLSVAVAACRIPARARCLEFTLPKGRPTGDVWPHAVRARGGSDGQEHRRP